MLTQQQLKEKRDEGQKLLAEKNAELFRLEKELERLYEERREIINRHNLNKEENNG